jgi:hypothetical protein
MPNHPAEVDILYAHAVDVKFVLIRKARDKFSHPALGAVSFIYGG